MWLAPAGATEAQSPFRAHGVAREAQGYIGSLGVPHRSILGRGDLLPRSGPGAQGRGVPTLLPPDALAMGRTASHSQGPRVIASVSQLFSLSLVMGRVGDSHPCMRLSKRKQPRSAWLQCGAPRGRLHSTAEARGAPAASSDGGACSCLTGACHAGGLLHGTSYGGFMMWLLSLFL